LQDWQHVLSDLRSCPQHSLKLACAFQQIVLKLLGTWSQMTGSEVGQVGIVYQTISLTWFLPRDALLVHMCHGPVFVHLSVTSWCYTKMVKHRITKKQKQCHSIVKGLVFLCQC